MGGSGGVLTGTDLGDDRAGGHRADPQDRAKQVTLAGQRDHHRLHPAGVAQYLILGLTGPG